MSGWQEVVKKEGSAWDREGRLEGTYVKRQDNIGPNESRMYTVKTSDGEVNVWGSTVLDTKFSEIPMGSMVRIDPLGKVKSEKTGREYMDFAVFWKEGDFTEAGSTPGQDKAREARSKLSDAPKQLDPDEANDMLRQMDEERDE